MAKIVKPKEGWPKDRCREAFHKKGKEASKALAEELGIANYRKERWLREFTEEAKKVPAKTVGKLPAKKAPAKKTKAKKSPAG